MEKKRACVAVKKVLFSRPSAGDRRAKTAAAGRTGQQKKTAGQRAQQRKKSNNGGRNVSFRLSNEGQESLK